MLSSWCLIWSVIVSSERVYSILEAHPDMIQGDEGATLEAYNSDLAYLKRKVIYCSSLS